MKYQIQTLVRTWNLLLISCILLQAWREMTSDGARAPQHTPKMGLGHKNSSPRSHL